ncbi:hypothetical protein ACET3Z_032405 [Daucus carota]
MCPLIFLVGLPVPITWIRNISAVSEKKKDERLDFSTQSTDPLSIFGSVRETIDPCYILVSGVCGDLWNDAEEASFLLGLYLFKKKFVELKKYVGSKKMGEILFFYHTEFHRSTGFNRWSTCSEGKCAYGTWLFTGFRHQELLSRLRPQAEIPDLITGPEYRSYLNRPVDTDNKDHVPFDFLVGLPVPVTWIKYVRTVSEKKKDEIRLDFSTQSTDSFSIDPCYVLVPGVCRDLWNDTEEAGFLLGLYLFKKKFVELKKFIGSKRMGEILYFYYTFYKSTGFNRWSTCSEGRKGKRAYGTCLFKCFRHASGTIISSASTGLGGKPETAVILGHSLTILSFCRVRY